MMKKDILVVMYHQIICEATRGLAEQHGMHYEDFASQVDWLKENHSLIDYSTFLKCIKGEEAAPDRAVLLTFDDGTRDHFEIIFPFLKQRGISGIFFVGTDALESGNLMPAHKRHLITTQLGFPEFQKAFCSTLEKNGHNIKSFKRPSEDVLLRSYPNHSKEEGIFKYQLNFTMPHDLRNTVLNELFQDACKIESSFYLHWEQIEQMQREGMTIGGHSHEHEALSCLDEEELSFQLKMCRDLLKHHLGERDFPFAYPYGRKEHYTKKAMRLLSEYDFSSAFANIPGKVTVPFGQEEDLYEICRVDCNDLEEYLSRNPFDV